MSVEQITYTKEFEQRLPREVERKFMPIFPERLEKYRTSSQPIEQFYLSHPDESFCLRLREFIKDGELNYEATIKDTGTVGVNGLDRTEVTAPVSAELYNFYRSPGAPIVRKLRAEPRPGITIDYYDDGSVQVESENPSQWQAFVAEHGNIFAETTGDRAGNNEWRAHLNFRQANDGRETLSPQPELDPSNIVRDIQQQLMHERTVTVHIGGRSGSGKSTVVREVQARLNGLGMSSTVLSTDDYHRGTSWLTKHNGGEPWTHWDEPIVYDTKTMDADLKCLQNGQTIRKREIDWTTAEPHFTATIEPSEVIIIEGIYALSSDITSSQGLSYEMTTPLATCIGRRLLRDMRERPEFADPIKSLGYMMAEAEPAYRRQRTM